MSLKYFEFTSFENDFNEIISHMYKLVITAIPFNDKHYINLYYTKWTNKSISVYMPGNKIFISLD